MAQGVYDRTDTLPPIGIKPGTPEARDAVQLLYARREGIRNALARPIRLAKECRRIAAWGENTEWPDECKTVVHKIRQSIETQVANHLKEPAQITIEPVETGEYAKWYWCGGPEAAAEVQIPTMATDQTGQPMADEMGQPIIQSMGIDPVYLGGSNPTTGETIPPQPLPLQLVNVLKQMAQAGEIDPTWFCQLNDEYTAKTIQKQFDAEWRTCSGHRWLRSRVFAATVEGWELPMIEFDHERQRFYLRDNSIEGTYIAQDHEHIDDSVEAGIDLYLDLDEAMALYPDQRDAFLKNDGWVSQGGLTAPVTASAVPPMYRDQYRRPMLRKIVWWLRNQPMLVPMTEQEAVSGGHVIPAQFATDPTQVGNVPPSSDGGDVSGPPAGPVGAPPRMGLDGNQQVNDDQASTDSGRGQVGAVEGSQDVSQGGFSLADGTPVDPSHPAWPTKTQFVLRQMTIVSDELVEDAVCQWPDIPLLHLRNSLIIGKPWSVGEPFYTKNLQFTISRIVTSASDHVEFVAHTPKTMPMGLKQAMEKEFGEAFVKPNDIIGLPAPYDQWKDPVVKVIEAPNFPESSFKILNLVVEQFNEISGRPDVLSGNTPTANASGELVANLQNAATEPLNFRAQDIAFALEKAANLIVYGILKWKDPQKISDTTSVPLPLLMLLIDRALRRPPQYKITISTGAGAVIHQKRAQFVQYNQTVDPASKMPLASSRTTQEVLGLDPDTEDARNEQAVKNAVASMGMMQPQEQGQQQQNGQKQPSSNGNGHGGRFGGM